MTRPEREMPARPRLGGGVIFERVVDNPAVSATLGRESLSLTAEGFLENVLTRVNDLPPPDRAELTRSLVSGMARPSAYWDRGRRNIAARLVAGTDLTGMSAHDLGDIRRRHQQVIQLEEGRETVVDHTTLSEKLDAAHMEASKVPRELVATKIAGGGNYEPKVELLVLMQPGVEYTESELSTLTQRARGVPDDEIKHKRDAAKFCDESLIPIGLVVKERKEREPGGRIRTVYYLADYDGLGKTVAEQMLAFSDRHSQIALMSLLGYTASAGKERVTETSAGDLSYKNRAPRTRINILEAVVSEKPPRTLTQLITMIGDTSGNIARHLNDLSERNILTYKTYTIDEGTVQYVRTQHSPNNLAEIFSIPADRGLQDAIVAELLESTAPRTISDIQKTLVDANSNLAGVDQSNLRVRIRKIASFLERTGYAAAHRNTTIRLLDDRPDGPPPSSTLEAHIALMKDAYDAVLEMEGAFTVEGLQTILTAQDQKKAALNQDSLGGVLRDVINHFEKFGYVVSRKGQAGKEFRVSERKPDDPPPPIIFRNEEQLLREMYPLLQRVGGRVTFEELQARLIAEYPEKADLDQTSLAERMKRVAAHLEMSGFATVDRDPEFVMRQDRPDDTPPYLTVSRGGLGSQVFEIIDAMDEPITIPAVQKRLLAAQPSYADLDQHLFADNISDMLNLLHDAGVIERPETERGSFTTISLTSEQRAVVTDFVNIIHAIETGDENVLAPGRRRTEDIVNDPNRMAELYEKGKDSNSRIGSVGKEAIKAYMLEIIGNGTVRSTYILAELRKPPFNKLLVYGTVAHYLNELEGEGRITREKRGKGYVYKRVDDETPPDAESRSTTEKREEKGPESRSGSVSELAQTTSQVVYDAGAHYEGRATLGDLMGEEEPLGADADMPLAQRYAARRAAETEWPDRTKRQGK